MASKKGVTAEDRFHSKYLINQQNGCWEWTDKITKGTHGNFRFNGRMVSPQRFSYEIYNGEIPKRKQVYPNCKNPKCVNPEHLFLDWFRKDFIPDDKTRFEQKYKIDTITDCWEWVGCKNKWGYGSFRFEKTTQLANRVSYKLYIGEIPDGMLVCHTCDNPGCVNPNHLWLGTNKDNCDDKFDKGRVKKAVHPSASHYQYGCRCEGCKEAKKEARKRWAENKKNKELQNFNPHVL